jgi:hypothetical protein
VLIPFRQKNLVETRKAERRRTGENSKEWWFAVFKKSELTGDPIFFKESKDEKN